MVVVVVVVVLTKFNRPAMVDNCNQVIKKAVQLL